MAPAFLARYLNFRTLFLFLFYIVVSSVSYLIAYELRFDFSIPENHAFDRINTIWWVVFLQVLLLAAGRQLDSILSYFRLPDAMRLFAALFANCLILLSMWYVYGGRDVPPRSVVLTHFLISFLLVAGFRIIMRVKSSRGLSDWFATDSNQNVIIVGAGEVGASLCSDLMNKKGLGMRPVAFLDDDARKVGRYIHGVLVTDKVDQLAKVAKRYSASKVAIAFPSATIRRVREVAELAQQAHLSVDTVPALTDIVSGRAEMSHLRPVELEDLLGREPVDLNSGGIRAMISGRRVIVTGAGGSIGSELVSQILDYEPECLLCVDQAEIAIFELERCILSSRDQFQKISETRVADVFNEAHMRSVFESFEPDVVFHAAAHKHVNLMEQQPAESLRNNFFATISLARIASEMKVERFVLISTDKAINPTSVMGASKRLAELALINQQKASDNITKFMAVRFGNVLGSSGSVIPIFKSQLANGGPITVTDPEVTRFFMTVEEAVGLVLQSATQGEGGEIFVLDMGESVKIIDVARQMIALSGMQEGQDIDIVFTGLKPGEKLYEEVQHLSEELRPTSHSRVMRFVSEAPVFDAQKARDYLEAEFKTHENKRIKTAIKTLVPEYTPSIDQ